MAETYWPFESGSGSASGEDRWMSMAPLWALDGVTTSSGLLVSTISGRNVQVAVGSAWVHGAYYTNDAAKTLAIAANASGNPRIDRVVLRRDLTANTVTALVVSGTAAASPTVPALTQVSTGIWEVPIAQYRAESGFTNTDPLKLTDERRITGASELDAHSVREFASTTARTTLVGTPVEGMIGWLRDVDRFESYNGTTWVPLAAARCGARIRRVANQSVANNTLTAMSWDTEDQDTHGFITATSTTVTIPAGCDGIYGITFRPVGPTGTAARNFAEINITSSLTGVSGEFRVPSSSPTTGEGRMLANYSGPLAAGDSFVCNVLQSSGSSQNFVGWLGCFRTGA